MAVSKYASGRAGSAQIEIQVQGLYSSLKKWAAADPMFNKEIRTSSVQLINEIVTEVKTGATYAPNPRQATEAAKGFRARPDRIPVIRLNGSSTFVSKTRPSPRRKKPVTRGDVFFGSEFGSNRLKQFPERSAPLGGGNQGYWFWPTIEAMAPTVRKKYLEALDRITANISRL